MTNRLIWNFEIAANNFDATQLPNLDEETIKWERRFFWDDKTIIILHGLDERFLNLDEYQIKSREDSYLLYAGWEYNLKKREGELFYKPLLERQGELLGFGKKIKLTAETQTDINNKEALSPAALITILNEKALSLAVSKTALSYKYPTHPPIKFELSKLNIKEKTFFSLCVEGRSQTLVRKLSKHLLPTAVSCDYVNFLRRFYHD